MEKFPDGYEGWEKGKVGSRSEATGYSATPIETVRELDVVLVVRGKRFLEGN